MPSSDSTHAQHAVRAGSRPAMIPKAAASAADSVCIDLEDSVAPDEKAGEPGQRRPRAQGDRLRPSHAHGPHQRPRHAVCLSRSRRGRRSRRRPPRPGHDSQGRFGAAMSSSWTCCSRRSKRARGLARRIGLEAQIETAAGFSMRARLPRRRRGSRRSSSAPAIMLRRCGCHRRPSASSTRTTRSIPDTAGTP